MTRFPFFPMLASACLFAGFTTFSGAEEMATPDVSKKEMGPRENGAFYKRAPFFAFRANEKRKGSIDRFGPVGIGIELHPPAFTMKVKNVEADSPAEKTGKIKKGQIIETINGRKLADIDPRIQLGDIIYHAEASDGKVTLVVRDKPDAPAQTVVVTIPRLGPYSPTWPLHCKKSDQIVSNLANYLRKRESLSMSHSHGPSLLFMLSTGEEKDLAVARQWVGQLHAQYKDTKQIEAQNWTIGYMGIALCEYYLRTGDRKAIHLIELLAEKARWDMYNDAWAHGTYQGQRDRKKAAMAFPYMGEVTSMHAASMLPRFW